MARVFPLYYFTFCMIHNILSFLTIISIWLLSKNDIIIIIIIIFNCFCSCWLMLLLLCCYQLHIISLHDHHHHQQFRVVEIVVVVVVVGVVGCYYIEQVGILKAHTYVLITNPFWLKTFKSLDPKCLRKFECSGPLSTCRLTLRTVPTSSLGGSAGASCFAVGELQSMWCLRD